MRQQALLLIGWFGILIPTSKKSKAASYPPGPALVLTVAGKQIIILLARPLALTAIFSKFLLWTRGCPCRLALLVMNWKKPAKTTSLTKLFSSVFTPTINRSCQL
jgi:hypothetical protein